MSYTVDASVIARWFIKGEEWEQMALRLRDDYVKGRVRLYAPAILTFECLNAVWKAYRMGLLSLEVAADVSRLIWKLMPETVELDPEDLHKVFKLSARLNLTCYDTSYIVVSVKTGSTLLTADRILYEKAREQTPTVHLSEYKGGW